ncbi:hypothetical protein EON77_11695 [bacterium]|nr:MAG: hypothetical protein EON77_11695 [bacterium]
MALVSFAPRLRGALWTCEPGGNHFGGIFENYCRLLLAYALYERGGLMVHSAAVARSDKGILFPGASGAGKSTLSAKATSANLAILSDDLNAVLPGAEDHQWDLKRIPFFGDLRPASYDDMGARLAAVVTLTKSEATRLVPEPSVRTQAALLASSPFLNRDPFRQDAWWSRVQAIAEDAASYRLFSTKEDSPCPLLAPLLR